MRFLGTNHIIEFNDVMIKIWEYIYHTSNHSKFHLPYNHAQLMQIYCVVFCLVCRQIILLRLSKLARGNLVCIGKRSHVNNVVKTDWVISLKKKKVVLTGTVWCPLSTLFPDIIYVFFSIYITFSVLYVLFKIFFDFFWQIFGAG